MSSYDPLNDVISTEEYRQSMKLVRLQIAVPMSVLISLGTNLVCALALKPGLKGINTLHPTLISPHPVLLGIYWAVLYVLLIGFCLILLLVRKHETKETLVKGVGMRFAIANWIQAGWAVAFTLQLFIVSEVLLLLNVLNILSIHITLLPFRQTLSRPLDTVFIHAPITLLLAVLFDLDWLHNGFLALNWVTDGRDQWGKYTLQAVISIAAVNVVTALWAGLRREYLLSFAAEYLLFVILFASPRAQPTLPSSTLPKPPALLITLVVCLVLHPLSVIAGVAWRRTREREGRIRLEEEIERAEEEEREAEAEAAREHAEHGHAERHANRA